MTATTQPVKAAPAGADAARRWIIVCLLSVGAIIAYCSRTNISAALAYKPFVEHFQLSNIDRGLMTSAFFSRPFETCCCSAGVSTLLWSA